MTHEIKNQQDNHITEALIRNEINHALDNDMTYTYFNEKRIDIVSDKKLDDRRVTLVKIEGV